MAKKKKRIKLNETESLFILLFPFVLIVVIMDIVAPEDPLKMISSIIVLIIIYLLFFAGYSFYLSYKNSKKAIKKRKDK